MHLLMYMREVLRYFFLGICIVPCIHTQVFEVIVADEICRLELSYIEL